MAFDGARRNMQSVRFAGERVASDAWRRDERFGLLFGAAAIGALGGFAATLMSGRQELWLLALIAAPFIAVSLHLTGLTLTDALSSHAFGCACACTLHGAALLAWPLAALAAPAAPLVFWAAPALALTALVLFASCWKGGARAIYRMGAQGLAIAALAAHHGVFVALGG